MRGRGLGRGLSSPGKKIFLYTGSVVRVSARSSFIADLRNGGPPADRNPQYSPRFVSEFHEIIVIAT